MENIPFQSFVASTIRVDSPRAPASTLFDPKGTLFHFRASAQPPRLQPINSSAAWGEWIINPLECVSPEIMPPSQGSMQRNWTIKKQEKANNNLVAPINDITIWYPSKGDQFQCLSSPLIKIQIPSFHQYNSKKHNVYLQIREGKILGMKCNCARKETGLCSHGAAACMLLTGDLRNLTAKNNSLEKAEFLQSLEGKVGTQALHIKSNAELKAGHCEKSEKHNGNGKVTF